MKSGVDVEFLRTDGKLQETLKMLETLNSMTNPLYMLVCVQNSPPSPLSLGSINKASVLIHRVFAEWFRA